MKTIGSRIKELRKKADLTQEEFARKADIPYATLLKIENDSVKNPTMITIVKIADALELKIDDLIKGKTTK